MTLTGNNSYSGTTSVAGGILNMNGSDYSTGISANGGAVYVNTASPATSVTVAGGAALGGTGSLTSATAIVANGGILDFSQNAGSTFLVGGVSYTGSGTLNLGALTAANANFNFLQSLGFHHRGPDQHQRQRGRGERALRNLRSGELQLDGRHGHVGLQFGFSRRPQQSPNRHAPGSAQSGRSGNRRSNALLERRPARLAHSERLDARQPSGNPTTSRRAMPTSSTIRQAARLMAAPFSSSSGNVATSSVTFNNLNLAYTVSGNYGITGSGAVAVQGGGTVTLLTSNSYTGATLVSNGTLQLGNGGATGSLSSSTPSTLGGNGVLAFSRSNNVVQGVDFSGSAIGGGGSLVQNGPGALILTANNTFNGTTTVSGGTLNLGTGANGQGGVIASTSGVTDNGVLVYDLLGNQTPSYAISGTGSLVMNGSGTLTSATNSYSGGTTVNSGLLLDTVSCWYTPRAIGGGMLTINADATAEFTATHGFGETASGQPATINGGTLLFDHENYVTNLYMTGGTLTGAGETRPTGGTVYTYPSTSPA